MMNMDDPLPKQPLLLNKRYNFDVLYHFSNLWKKKSIICAEDVILREKNFHGKKCYNMCLKLFLCVADLILLFLDHIK